MGHANMSSIDLNEPMKDGGKIPLSKVLNPASRYLWIMTPPGEAGSPPGLHIGFDVQTEKGKVGHPALLGPDGQRRAVLAGELVHRGGRWVINNDSGRYHGGNAAALKEMGLHKGDVLAAAAHQIQDLTDLKIGGAEQYSGNTSKFLRQQTGWIGPRSIELPSDDSAATGEQVRDQ
jgi:hypothetical protein